MKNLSGVAERIGLYLLIVFDMVVSSWLAYFLSGVIKQWWNDPATPAIGAFLLKFIVSVCVALFTAAAAITDFFGLFVFITGLGRLLWPEKE